MSEKQLKHRKPQAEPAARAAAPFQDITRLSDGWTQVKVPLPFSLRWVNSYLISEPSGTYTIVDPGLRTEEAIALWERVLKQEELQWEDIGQIILTHQHPDHYGLAGYIQERSEAPVYISRRSYSYAIRLWGEQSVFAKELRTLYEEHGMPTELMSAIEDNLNSFPAMVSPQPVVTFVEAGERIRIGGDDWQTIDAPGHAYGGLCFYSIEKQWMLCGDQVLPRITPNISVIPGEEYNPLADFLKSLDELKRYEVKLALPGHREPFAGFSQRIDELISHHERRLTQMCELLAEEPQTAFQLCEKTFGSHLRSSPHNLRFAMSETLAHLHYLEQQGGAKYTLLSSTSNRKPVKLWE